jgi:hypothetical protein
MWGIEELICSLSAGACLLTQTYFVLRAAQKRRVEANEAAIEHLLDQVRAWPSQNPRRFEVPPSHGRAGRETRLDLSFGQVSILPPWNDPRGSNDPLMLGVVRVS